jgi:arginine-tRNA-protein transferase
MEYVSPLLSPDKTAYSWLVGKGFRRSGEMIYRPHCPGCRACIPVRIPVDRFQPNRSQRRIMQMNSDLVVINKLPVFDQSHYQLYLRYLRMRHPEGQMVESTGEDYIRFLSALWGETTFHEFRKSDQLLAVAVVDHLSDGLSAVYTFYDPGFKQRSLGTYAVLWQIREAERLKLQRIYLGFWILECRKMSYKGRFRPLEAFNGREWVIIDKGDNTTV